MRIAYITGRYPAISHTFITREVRALRAIGVGIDTFTVWATDEASLLSQVDREEHDSTYALLPLRLGTIVAHLAAVRAGPNAYLAMARQALALRRSGLRGLVMALAWFAAAGALWHQCARRGIRHIHAHINGTAPVLAMLVAQFGNKVGGPEWLWSMTVHGPSEFYDALQERLSEKVRAATFVVCISDFARSQLMGMVEAVHWPKLRIVHCGVDTERFSPGPGHHDDRPVRILNVGRLTPVKGQAVLVEALAQLRADGIDARLTIVGEGPARAEIEDAARRLGVSDHLTLPGAVGQCDIRSLYEDSSIFCLSSFAEGVPVVLMEAMAMEIPVVAPAIMGIPELVDSGVSGVLIRPGRADQMAEAVRELARSPESRARLGRAARKTIIDEFNIDSSAEQLAELFRAGTRREPMPEPVGVR